MTTTHTIHTEMDQGSGLPSTSIVRRIMWLSVALGFFAMLSENPYNKAPENMLLGAAIVVLGLLPLSTWLAIRGERRVPLLAMHGIFYAICFGVAGFVTSEQFISDIRVTESTHTPALFAALLSWLMLLAGYRFAAHWRAPSPSMLRVDSLRLDRLAVLALYPTSAATLIFIKMADLDALVQIAIAVHLFTFIWILHAAWSGRLPGVYRWLVLILAVPTEVLVFGGVADGKLAGLLVYGQILGITYVITRGRIPLISGILVVVLFAFLQPVKTEYRQLTWSPTFLEVGTLERIGLFLDMATSHLSSESSYGLSGKDIFDVAYSRINHLHTTATVMADTPSVQPFRNGETLVPLLTKWIPRAVWPEKPKEDLGNRWAQDYGYLGSDDYETSYNLPWLTEMYMNFGWLGVVGLSFVVGILMGSLWAWLIVRPAGSVQFAFALMLASSFFFPESNLSLLLGNLIISGLTVLLLLFGLLGVTRIRISRGVLAS